MPKNLTTIATFLTVATVVVGCQRGPSQKEVFDMQTQCGQMGEKEKTRINAEAGLPFQIGDVVSHYDSAKNRCLLHVRAATTGGMKESLVDAQSHARLAECLIKDQSGESVCSIGSTPSSTAAVSTYITQHMGDAK